MGLPLNSQYFFLSTHPLINTFTDYPLHGLTSATLKNYKSLEWPARGRTGISAHIMRTCFSWNAINMNFITAFRVIWVDFCWNRNVKKNKHSAALIIQFVTNPRPLESRLTIAKCWISSFRQNWWNFSIPLFLMGTKDHLFLLRTTTNTKISLHSRTSQNAMGEIPIWIVMYSSGIVLDLSVNRHSTMTYQVNPSIYQW